jgi:uncharacterized protein YfdQ (DUF2303 family)
MSDTNYGENGTIARDLGEQYRELLKTEFVDIGKSVRQAAIVADGRTLLSLKPLLDEYLEKPERRKGTVVAKDMASFVAIIRRFKSEASVGFADPAGGGKEGGVPPSLMAVFDYHPAGGESTKADWLLHRAHYVPALSDEYLAWKAKNGAFMSQQDFASFIEERITDVSSATLTELQEKFAELMQGTFATPSELVTLSRGLEINVGGTVKNAVRTSSGEISVVFNQAHTDAANQPIKVPNLFQIAIPVFYGGAAYRVNAWLRYRVNGGAITWGYQLVRPDIVFKDAFDEIVAKVREDTGVPVYVGTPDK